MASVDVSSLDHRGDRLKCPSCGRFVGALAVLDAGECRCRRCETEAAEHADAEVSDRARPGTSREAADGAG